MVASNAFYARLAEKVGVVAPVTDNRNLSLLEQVVNGGRDAYQRGNGRVARSGGNAPSNGTQIAYVPCEHPGCQSKRGWPTLGLCDRHERQRNGTRYGAERVKNMTAEAQGRYKTDLDALHAARAAGSWKWDY